MFKWQCTNYNVQMSLVLGLRYCSHLKN